MKKRTLLWTAFLAGPAIWFASQIANFALAPWTCALGWKPAVYVISIIALALTAGSGFLAWTEWQRVGREFPGEATGAVPNDRVLASGGVLLSGMFFLVILAQGIAEAILGACS